MERNTETKYKDLAIIILDWNGVEDTEECLKCLNNFELYDIYLLNNGSKPENTKRLRELLYSDAYKDLAGEKNIPVSAEQPHPINYIESDYNYGFSGGNNLIATAICSQYEYVLLLNNDTYVPEGAIEHMLSMAREKQCVAITCDIRNYYRQQELWNAGGVFTIIGERRYFSQRKIDRLKSKGVEYINADFITGCAMLIDCRHIEENGLFTDKFFHGEEDFNLCYKLAKEKKRVGVDLQAVIYHKIGKTITRMSTDKKTYGGMLVNYCNRVIDFKEFYSEPGWLAWRGLYILLLFFKRTAGGMNAKDAAVLCKRIISITSSNDDVKKPVFDEIMKMKW